MNTINFHEIYNPITANPFCCNETYQEWKPCSELQPYIKCFWGAAHSYKQVKDIFEKPSIITPDTCVDIIFDIDFTNNKILGCFSGINDKAFVIENTYIKDKVVSTFAIRFFAWTAFLFAEESMCNSKNSYIDVDYYFSNLRKVIEPLLFDVVDIEKRIKIAENFLLNNIHLERCNPILMESIDIMINRKGNIQVGELVKDIHTSGRHLERLFKEHIGISPKKLASLIRYQYLWNDILYNADFNVLDAVCKYGYSDQAHLLNDFKRFHNMNISDAAKYAKITI